MGIRTYPETQLATIAVEQGLINGDDDLLFPRFYMVKGLRDWLIETVMDRAKEHSNWTF